MNFLIREIEPEDWESVWSILQPVFSEGETYAYPPDMSEEQARYEWVEKPEKTFVVAEGRDILGTYYLKTNQPGQGSHVCNCGYIVAEHARGRGMAKAMCLHSQEKAREMGYLAMQYNLVAASNSGALALWHKMGFETVGCLPRAFRSPSQGLVDAYVLYKHLKEDSET